MIDSSQKIKRLLAFCYEFPPIGGGAGNALYHLCKEWVSCGIEVTVITSSHHKKYVVENVEGIRVIRLNVGRKEVGRGRIREMVRYMYHSVVEGLKVCREMKPDLNIAFMSLPSGLAPWILSKKLNVPYITELRGGDVPGFDRAHLGLYHLFLKPLIESIWRRSACLIANGAGLQQLASKAFKKKYPIHFLPNGVDADYFKPSSKERNREIPSTAIAVGRLVDSQKNFSGLIHIFSKIPNWRLMIVGDGPDKRLLQRKCIDLKVQNIRFVGWSNKDQLLQLYRDSDCYISASRYEGMPNTALEAMATGLPLILSDIGGHRELVEDSNGLLFQEDAQKVIDFFQRCIDSPEILNQMSSHSRKKSLKEFSWKDIAIQRLELYKASLNKKEAVFHG